MPTPASLPSEAPKRSRTDAAPVILYFVRHGKAGHHSAAADDDERTLSEAGVAALRSAAPLWRRANLRPDVIISSPLPRALQTAELVRAGIGFPDQPVVDDRLRPGASWGDFARAMVAHPAARRIVFVGHEPDLSDAVCLLTGAAAVRMRKGGIACVEFPGIPDPGAGELAWLLDPDLYDDPSPTPAQLTRVAAYGLCLDDAGRILLCRLAQTDPERGMWTLPGGGVEFGEPPVDAAVRELMEETGLTGEVVSLAGVEPWLRGPVPDGPSDDLHSIQIIYRMRITGGSLRDELDGSTDTAAWFTRAQAMDLPLVDLVRAGLRLLDAG